MNQGFQFMFGKDSQKKIQTFKKIFFENIMII